MNHFHKFLFLPIVLVLSTSCAPKPISGVSSRVQKAIRATVKASSLCIDRTTENATCRINYQPPEKTLITGRSVTLLFRNGVYRKEPDHWSRLATVDFVKPVSITALEALATRAVFTSTSNSTQFMFRFRNINGESFKGALELDGKPFDHVSRLLMAKEDGSEGFDVSFTQIGNAPRIDLPG